MELSDGSRVGVVGGGPAGSLAGYFLLEMAGRIDLRLEVDIYEPRDFSLPGPAGCNMGGGVISESLVQLLATEGINLPPSLVQRGIDSYVLHMDRNEVQVRTPLEEMRIAALHRGSGPKGCPAGQWESFDGFLLDLAGERGANRIKSRVEEIRWESGMPVIRARGMPEETYDLVVGAVGVNSRGLKLFRNLGFHFREPRTTRTYAAEILLGREKVQECLGDSIHIFLLDIPRLQFAAFIPKGECVTVCMLGHEVDQELVNRFMTSAEVRGCLPGEWDPGLPACQCWPRINIGCGRHIFSDRVVLVGDCGTSRIYKDGIGAAYRNAKAYAIAAVFHGVSRQDFRKFYCPMCRRMELDNIIGKLLFMGAGTSCRRLGFLRRAMLRMARKEQNSESTSLALSMMLWDMFTGSAPYRDVFLRSLMPGFVFPFTAECLKALFRIPARGSSAE